MPASVTDGQLSISSTRRFSCADILELIKRMPSSVICSHRERVYNQNNRFIRCILRNYTKVSRCRQLSAKCRNVSSVTQKEKHYLICVTDFFLTAVQSSRSSRSNNGQPYKFIERIFFKHLLEILTRLMAENPESVNWEHKVASSFLNTNFQCHIEKIRRKSNLPQLSATSSKSYQCIIRQMRTIGNLKHFQRTTMFSNGHKSIIRQ